MSRTKFLAVSLPFILVACGGGSDCLSGVCNPQTGGTPSGLAITPANAQSAVGEAYSAGVSIAGVDGFIAATGLTASEPGAVNKPALGNALQAAKAISALAVAFDPFGPDTIPCTVSGSITISGDLADVNMPTAGDTLLLEIVDCDNGDGIIIRGTLSVRIDSFEGDPLSGLFALGQTLTFTNFQAATATDTVTLNGDHSSVLDSRANPTISASYSGNSLTTDANQDSTTISNFSGSESVDTGSVDNPYVQESAATIDSTLLTAQVSYTTPVPLQGTNFDFPSVGEILVVGANNSSARLIAVDSVNVMIEIDSNGDGVIDETIDTTWVAVVS